MKTITEISNKYGVDIQMLRKMAREGSIRAYKRRSPTTDWCVDDDECSHVLYMSSLPRLSDLIDSNHPRYVTAINMCRKGAIKAVKFSSHWVVKLESVAKVKKVAQYCTPGDVRKKLGISPYTLGAMVRNGYIKAHRIGGTNYFNKEAMKLLKEYKNALTKKSYMEINKMSPCDVDYLIESGSLDTFKFGKRIMIKDK